MACQESKSKRFKKAKMVSINYDEDTESSQIGSDDGNLKQDEGENGEASTSGFSSRVNDNISPNDQISIHNDLPSSPSSSVPLVNGHCSPSLSSSGEEVFEMKNKENNSDQNGQLPSISIPLEASSSSSTTAAGKVTDSSSSSNSVPLLDEDDSLPSKTLNGITKPQINKNLKNMVDKINKNISSNIKNEKRALPSSSSSSSISNEEPVFKKPKQTEPFGLKLPPPPQQNVNSKVPEEFSKKLQSSIKIPKKVKTKDTCSMSVLSRKNAKRRDLNYLKNIEAIESPVNDEIESPVNGTESPLKNGEQTTSEVMDQNVTDDDVPVLQIPEPESDDFCDLNNNDDDEGNQEKDQVDIPPVNSSPTNENSSNDNENNQEKEPDDDEDQIDNLSTGDKSMEAIELLCQQQNLKIVDVNSQGNCLFESISIQVNGTTEEHVFFRKLAVLHLESNTELHQFIPAGTSIEQYCRKMSMIGEWGGEHEISALSLALNRTIFVFQPNSVTMEYPSPKPSNLEPIRLLYVNRDHYMAIVKQDFQVSPANVNKDFQVPQSTEMKDSKSNFTLPHGLKKLTEKQKRENYPKLDKSISVHVMKLSNGENVHILKDKETGRTDCSHNIVLKDCAGNVYIGCEEDSSFKISTYDKMRKFKQGIFSFVTRHDDVDPEVGTHPTDNFHYGVCEAHTNASVESHIEDRVIASTNAIRRRLTNTLNAIKEEEESDLDVQEYEKMLSEVVPRTMGERFCGSELMAHLHFGRNLIKHWSRFIVRLPTGKVGHHVKFFIKYFHEDNVYERSSLQRVEPKCIEIEALEIIKAHLEIAQVPLQFPSTHPLFESTATLATPQWWCDWYSSALQNIKYTLELFSVPDAPVYEYCCKFCNKGFQTDAKGIMHMCRCEYRGSVIYKCKFCEKQTLNKSNLKDHQLGRSSGNRKASCPGITKDIILQFENETDPHELVTVSKKSGTDSQEHLVNYLGNYKESNKQKYDGNKRLPCVFCKKDFSDKKCLVRHQTGKKGKETFEIACKEIRRQIQDEKKTLEQVLNENKSDE